MKTFIKVTDRSKFNIFDVDLEGVESNVSRRSFVAGGPIEIEELSGTRKNFSGQHGRHDFEKEYGFILITLEEKIEEEAKEDAIIAFDQGKGYSEEKFPNNYFERTVQGLRQDLRCEIILQDMEDCYIPAWEEKMSDLIEGLKSKV